MPACAAIGMSVCATVGMTVFCNSIYVIVFGFSCSHNFALQNIEWTFGFNKDAVNGVHSLTAKGSNVRRLRLFFLISVDAHA